MLTTIFVTVNSNNLFVIFQYLVWCKCLFVSPNFRNFSPVLVLEVDLADGIRTTILESTSDLFDLGVQNNCLEAICILALGREDRRSKTVGIDHLQSSNTSIFSRFPAKFDGLNGLVFWHGAEVCIGWVPEVDSISNPPKER